MKILFILAVLSFAALAWAAFAITRHIRNSAAKAGAPSASENEIDEAIENRLTNLARPSGEYRIPTIQRSGQRDVLPIDGSPRPGSVATTDKISRHKVS